MAKKSPAKRPVRFDISFVVIIAICVLWLVYQFLSKASPTDGAEQKRTATLIDRVDSLQNWGLPLQCKGEQLVQHRAYTLSYSEEAEQASWVGYFLSAKNYQARINRKDADAHFKADVAVSTGSASLEDYHRSGYDRGHLAPAGDMKVNATTYAESFLMSNMSPQDHGLNTGLWRRIEEKVRKWQGRDAELWVVSGPVLRPGLPTIGPNKVAVPEAYYKVVLDYREPEIKMIGFLVPNADSDLSIEKFCTSVDAIEKATGIDFFYNIPDPQEKALEAQNDIKTWFAR